MLFCYLIAHPFFSYRYSSYMIGVFQKSIDNETRKMEDTSPPPTFFFQKPNTVIYSPFLHLLSEQQAVCIEAHADNWSKSELLYCIFRTPIYWQVHALTCNICSTDMIQITPSSNTTGIYFGELRQLPTIFGVILMVCISQKYQSPTKVSRLLAKGHYFVDKGWTRGRGQWHLWF